MATVKYVVEIGNTAQGGNNAFVDFDVDAANLDPVPEIVAQFTAYVVGAMWAASNTFIVGISRRGVGEAGSVGQAFPVSEYAVLAAANAELPALTGWSQNFGTGDLTPVGTSITVMERTASPGRSFTGRHYLPFTRSAAVGADGRLGGAQALGTFKYYTYYLLGESAAPLPGPPPAPLGVVVRSDKLNVQTIIVTASVMRTLANLRTRRS